tara:strand:- start:293 stop:904 length:612 start_codon:yes stop_codon:yes gene_type:complete
MTERIKKLRFIQVSLLVIGLLIIFFTYSGRQNSVKEEIISQETQKKIQKQINEERQAEGGDIFYNIEYSGLDLSGNRYILKSEEASNEKTNKDIVNMRIVEAIFFFKDDTELRISSDSGTYNNKTLDMSFNGNIKASYEGSNLYAQKAEYSNSKSFLIISDEVKIDDIRGSMVADKLYFDIKKQTLNIASSNDKKINTNVNLK